MARPKPASRFQRDDRVSRTVDDCSIPERSIESDCKPYPHRNWCPGADTHLGADMDNDFISGLVH